MARGWYWYCPNCNLSYFVARWKWLAKLTVYTWKRKDPEHFFTPCPSGSKGCYLRFQKEA